LRLGEKDLVEDDTGDIRYPRNCASAYTSRSNLFRVLHFSHMPDKPVGGDSSIVEHGNVDWPNACVGGSWLAVPFSCE
jgi:hypothetical protein